jgi:group I intron endonuclease
MGEVYKITNTINGKCYIGITKNSFRKRYNHRDDWWNAPTASKVLKKAVDKYGSDNFIVEIIEECKLSVLESREKYYIDLYNSFSPNGYNLTTGGNYNYSVSLESKKKNSRTNKERYKKGAVTWNKGKSLTEEHKKRSSNTKKRKFANGELVTWNKGLKLGKMKKEHVENSAKAHKKRVVCINPDNNQVVKEYEGLIDTKKDGFTPSCVSLCCKNKIKLHKGFNWEYVNN